MKGHIHSLESFGTVDGPGVRFVVFFQGCPMRCQYCHNPDTWKIGTGTEMEVSEIIDAYERNKGFYRGGGITATGGEPMVQIDFLIELFEECHQRKINTCLDTSGIMYNENNPENVAKTRRLLAVTDLVMLDIKHIDPVKHKSLTSQENTQILAFANFLSENNIPIWIRHVVVPGITDDDKYLFDLGYFIGNLKTLKALDVLPYHTMGEVKYKSLGMDYPLKGIPAMEKDKVIGKKQVILEGIRKRRAELNQ